MGNGTDHTADYKALAVLTKALISGILLFSVLSIVLHYLGNISDKLKEDSQVAFSSVLILCIIVILITRAIYTKRINVLKETNQSNKAKLDIFRSITITHMALCEFPALLSIICFIIFGNFLFFIAVAIALAEMLLKFPTRERMESAINSGTF
jgi:hypothetical protein